MKFRSSGLSPWGEDQQQAAAAIMPITAGRIPSMAPSTHRLFLQFQEKRATRIISVSDGRQTAKVAMHGSQDAAPDMPGLHPTE